MYHILTISGSLILSRYICQYVEVRQTSPGQAAKWLALQGLFAVIRVAIWIWNPDFDDFVMERQEPGRPGHYANFSEAQMVMLWYTHVHSTRLRRYVTSSLRHHTQTRDEMDIYEQIRQREARPPNWRGWEPPANLQIPIWVPPALDYIRSDMTKSFSLAQRLRQGGPTWHKDLDEFAGAEYFWDMPGWVFMLWIDAHTNQDLIANGSEWKAYSCRVIQTAEKEYHFIPYWTTCQIYKFIPGHQDESVKGYHYIPNDEIPFKAFGDPAVDERFIGEFSHSNSEDAAVPRKQQLLVGWERTKDEKRKLAEIRTEIINETSDMWRDLEAICLRARKRET